MIQPMNITGMDAIASQGQKLVASVNGLMLNRVSGLTRMARMKDKPQRIKLL